MIWLKVTRKKTEKRTHNIHYRYIYISYIKIQHKKRFTKFIHNISRRCRSQVVYSQAATNNDKTQSHWREQACGIWPDGRYTLIVFNYQAMFKYYIDFAYSNSVILLCYLVMFRVRWFQSNKHFQETKINLLRCPPPVDQAIWACRPGAQGPDKISNAWGLGSAHVGLRCIKMCVCVHLFDEMKWNDKLEGMFILFHTVSFFA